MDISLEDVEEARLELCQSANGKPFGDPGSVYGLIASQLGIDNTWKNRKRVLDALRSKQVSRN